MKALFTAIFAVMLFALPSMARADSCGTVPSQLENRALDEAKANHSAVAFSDFKVAKDQRRACIRTTTGETQNWNAFWGAFDEWGMSKATDDNHVSKFWMADAHKVCGNLLSFHVTGQLLTLTKQVWNDTVVK
jgi:hypothetical protein